MKKLIAIVGLAAMTTMVNAQGYIEFVGSVAGISTNNTLSGFNQPGVTQTIPGTGSGRTLTGASGTIYDYALLFATTTNATDQVSPLGSDWTLATMFGGSSLMGTNYNIAGNMSGPGNTAGVQVNMAAGTTYYAMLVGWSANLGTSWSSIANQLSNTNWSTTGYFGVTSVGQLTPFATAGAGDPTLFPGTWGNGTFTMYQVVPVPEPTTIALAGLGGLSLLLFRRRK